MHINNIELNALLDSDKIYITQIDKSDQIPSLIHIDSVICPKNSVPEELDKIVRNLKVAPDILNIIISEDDYVLTQFPHTENITGEDLKQIINFEVKQNFGDIPPNEIKCLLTPLDNLITNKDYVLVTLFRNKLIDSLTKFKSLSNLELRIQFSGDTTLNSFRFNYPEYEMSVVAIAGIFDNVLLLSVISPGGLAFMQFREYNEIQDCTLVLSGLFEKIRIESDISINKLFLYGEKLTMRMLEQLKSDLTGIDVFRYNAFRKLTGKLEKRQQEYCSRTMHIYPPCIGASLPSNNENIEFL